MFAFESIVEEKIREAIAAGEFDHLPGKGKPLSFDDSPSWRPEERLAYLVLKNANYLPEPLQLRKELEIALHELDRFGRQCHERLGEFLSHARALRSTQTQNFPEQPVAKLEGFVLRCDRSFRQFREQKHKSQRGKDVRSCFRRNGSQQDDEQLKALYRVYLNERQWLRNHLKELALKADEIAKRLQAALVENEIRDHRPLVLLLGHPQIATENLLSQFDREFPVVPREFSHD
ncbi:MAG: DUF1992 domain-containing protein [candidate division KSB1 bacterium]|nr:DUF1992 domain-containing protein [candidate division KSB1 bacterium]MDZ7303417.1 DUF1992 domain-containing protein [candidate division KSB1 bacterium]MDZ7312499.1 DUF1992 domain-containing protein [candidate division KSB1 bacterium]